MTNSKADNPTLREKALVQHQSSSPDDYGYEYMANWWLTQMYQTQRLNMGDCAAVAQVYATLALVSK